MGKLWYFDVAAIWRKYDLRHFVETGTGEGESLFYASSLPFSTLWSCDIEQTVLDLMQNRFARHPKVKVFCSSSKTMLMNILPNIPVNEPILFWLDAHYPGADYKLKGYTDEPDENIRLPLNDEISMIRGYRSQSEDVIIIDDARIWVDGTFDSEEIPDSYRLPERGIKFIEDKFGSTHNIEILYQNQGSIVLTPRKEHNARDK